MKNLWIALLLLLTISACLPKKIDKQDDLVPDLAGTYQITNLSVNGSTFLPKQGNSGQVIVTKNSETQLSLALSLNEGGSVSTDNLGTVTIRKASGNQYEMVAANGTPFGTVDGVSFVLNIAGSGGTLYIAAKK